MARRTKGAAPAAVIFDTDILIWYFRGHQRARAVLTEYPWEERWLTALSLMELAQGCRDADELADTQAFVAENFSRILHPTAAVSEKAIQLISQFALSHGLRVVDALIGASALLSRATLITGNARHYRFIPGLLVHPFAA